MQQHVDARVAAPPLLDRFVRARDLREVPVKESLPSLTHPSLTTVAPPHSD